MKLLALILAIGALLQASSKIEQELDLLGCSVLVGGCEKPVKVKTKKIEVETVSYVIIGCDKTLFPVTVRKNTRVKENQGEI